MRPRRVLSLRGDDRKSDDRPAVPAHVRPRSQRRRGETALRHQDGTVPQLWPSTSHRRCRQNAPRARRTGTYPGIGDRFGAVQSAGQHRPCLSRGISSGTKNHSQRCDPRQAESGTIPERSGDRRGRARGMHRGGERTARRTRGQSRRLLHRGGDHRPHSTRGIRERGGRHHLRFHAGIRRMARKDGRNLGRHRFRTTHLRQ